MFKRRHRDLISYIAMAAVLFAALAPAISHAFPAKQAPLTLWQELCTAQGTKRIAVNISASASTSGFAAVDFLKTDWAKVDVKPGAKSGTPVPEKMAMHFEHCPYCLSHAAALSLPPGAMQLFLAQLNTPEPASQYHAPSLAVYYPSTHATRAPPLI